MKKKIEKMKVIFDNHPARQQIMIATKHLTEARKGHIGDTRILHMHLTTRNWER